MNAADVTTQLETLIERHGLANLIGALAIACEENAQHVRDGWVIRPAASAKAWTRASRVLDKAEASVKAVGL